MKVATGIKLIDDATDGGFAKGSNIVLYGPPMSGKSQFTTQFVVNAILNNEIIIFVTTNETYEQVQAKIRKLNSEIDLPNDNFILIDSYSALLSSIREAQPPKNITFTAGPADLNDLSIALRQVFQKFTGKEITIKFILDSISTFFLYNSRVTLGRFLHVVTGWLRQIGTVSLFVVEDGMQDDASVNTIKQFSDGFLEFNSEGQVHKVRIKNLRDSKFKMDWIDIK